MSWLVDSRMVPPYKADGCSVKLSAHIRLMRAGMYALSVAISFWVSPAFGSRQLVVLSRLKLTFAADAGRNDLQHLSLPLDRGWRIHRACAV